ncbi:DUF2891 family protein [Cupriavidus basilensis]|uniref:DUF2891 family protein n=1 Tax=Cupriavidus basilensis TaxID=68895 RepID=A0ABT6ARQ6_9BURK|nr:DUF2891 family protein [Cupriavidus basilensis]MDF3835134.1 DUF2891 family protein [Cupriavidus basilensis]
MKKTTPTSFKPLAVSAVVTAFVAGCGGEGDGNSTLPVVAPVPTTSKPEVPVVPLPALGPLFEEQRGEMLKALSSPIINCLPQINSYSVGTNNGVNADSPIFHGCFDWHSAVHAAYSLYSIYRHTGDNTYLRVVEAVVRPDLVEAEKKYMNENVYSNPFEKFYGLSWFLALARERELATGHTDMRGLGNEVALNLRKNIEALTPQQARRNVLNDNYNNLSWALIHLDLWGKFIGDEALVTYAQKTADAYLLDPTLDEGCPITKDAGFPSNFFSPCIMRVAAIAKIYGSKKVDWIKERVPDNFYVEPINVPPTDLSHINGDNFSRSFALWWIHQATNQKTMRANSIRLLADQLQWRSRWDYAFDYNYLSHWIAQYAVRMIDASYEPNSPGAEAELPLQLALGDAWAFGGNGKLPDGSSYVDLLKIELEGMNSKKIRSINISKYDGYPTNPATLSNLVDKRLPYALELISTWQRENSIDIRNPLLITLHTGFDVKFITPSTAQNEANRMVLLQDQNAKMAAANDWAIVRANLNTVLSNLKAAAPKTKIIVGTYDNSYRDCPLAVGRAATHKTVSEYLEGSIAGTKGLNDVIREVAKSNNVAVAEIYGKLGSGDWAPDCRTPNAQGQAKIATAFKSMM